MLLFHFSFLFYLKGKTIAIVMPLLNFSPFISNFDAFSPKDICCFNQEQPGIKTRFVKEMSLCIFPTI